MNRELFLEGMSHAASTVSVVTTDGPAGRAGLTVSAMCSVSAEPPSLLVCIHQKSRACEALQRNKHFCVNVLRDDQQHVSDVFAGRVSPPGGDRFASAAWRRRAGGSLGLVDALVVFDCRVNHHFNWASHVVFIADIVDLEVAAAGEALIYANRAYGTPVKSCGFPPLRGALVGDREDRILRVGCSITLGPFLMPPLVAEFAAAEPEVEVRIREGEQSALLHGITHGELDVALLYNVEPREGVEIKCLTEVLPYVLLPSRHALAGGPAVALRDLAKHPMVLLDTPASRRYFLSLFADAGLKPYIAFRSPSFEMVRGLVGNGLGYGLLVTKPANSMSYDGKALVYRPVAGAVRSSSVVAVVRAGVAPHALLDNFLELCRSRIRGPRPSKPAPGPRPPKRAASGGQRDAG